MRKRNYKAEYATRKNRAKAAGYSGVREYTRTRKQLGLKPNARISPIPKAVLKDSNAKDWGMRSRAKIWSDAHSRTEHSRYKETLTNAQVERYYHAFVEDLPPGINEQKQDFIKRQRIKKYLVPDFLKDDKEWSANPSTIPLRR